MQRILRIVFIIAIALGTMGGRSLVPREQTDQPVVESKIYLPVASRNFIQASGDLSGLVSDAADGSAIAGAHVCSGSVCVDTGSDGNYTLANLPGGMRTINISASGQYIANQTGVYVVPGQTTTANFPLSKTLNEGEIRIVLTWSPNTQWCDTQNTCVDNDLDAHLNVPLISGTVEVSWENIGTCDLAEPFACLENDARQGSGPESMFISEVQQGTYTYFVENYSAARVNPQIAAPLPDTDAQVRVYGQNGLIQAYDVPPFGDGFWWVVFDIDLSGNIIGRDVITSTNPAPNP